MKTAKQWVDENSQSGAFDTVGSCKEAEALVLSIQRDAQAQCELPSSLLKVSIRIREHNMELCANTIPSAEGFQSLWAEWGKYVSNRYVELQKSKHQ